MPKIEVSEEQVLSSLEQLSPRARKEALRRLLPTPDYLDQAVQQNLPRLEALARQRGLDWSRLTEEQRESLIDEILHE
jgi:hypothetical protein